MDKVDKETRSRMMAGIKSTNTKPELLIRHALHARGFRYRINDRKLPGKPDIVLKKYRAVIFINGCFWHGHDCHLFKRPKTRTDFWIKKIEGNKKRDQTVKHTLLEGGWRICTVWECSIKGKNREALEKLIIKISDWIFSNNQLTNL